MLSIREMSYAKLLTRNGFQTLSMRCSGEEEEERGLCSVGDSGHPFNLADAM